MLEKTIKNLTKDIQFYTISSNGIVCHNFKKFTTINTLDKVIYNGNDHNNYVIIEKIIFNFDNAVENFKKLFLNVNK